MNNLFDQSNFLIENQKDFFSCNAFCKKYINLFFVLTLSFTTQ